MSEKTRAELKEQIKIMNHNYQVIRKMHERGYQYSISEIKRLQTELERTRKALDVAIDALEMIDSGKILEHSVFGHENETKTKIAHSALKQITALEQKDVK